MRKWVGRLKDLVTNPDEAFNKMWYTEFVEKYVSQVVGSHSFQKKKANMLFGCIATDSDETLAMLLLLNSYERWISMYLDPGKETEDEWKATVYSQDRMGRKAAKYSGWSVAGVLEYKRIKKLVIALRETRAYKEFEYEFKAGCHAKLVEARQHKMKKTYAECSLDDEDEDEVFAAEVEDFCNDIDRTALNERGPATRGLIQL